MGRVIGKARPIKSPAKYAAMYATALERCMTYVKGTDGKDMDEWLRVATDIPSRTGIGGAESIANNGGHWARSFKHYPLFRPDVRRLFEVWCLYFRVSEAPSSGPGHWIVECRLRRRPLARDLQIMREAEIINPQNTRI